MTRFIGGLLLVSVLISTAAGQAAVVGTGEAAMGEEVVDLQFRTIRKWKFELPQETWTPVGGGIHFADGFAGHFKTGLAGTSLEVDTDGDGVFDVKADGTDALLTLRQGKRIYSIRLKENAGWKFAPGGALFGKLGGRKIQIVDQNNNGRFDDYGVDAMIVGRGRYMSFLSRVVNIDGALLEIDVAGDGTRLTAKPFTGPTGRLVLAYETKAKVLAAVLKSHDGRFSFDGARAAKGMKVPAGTYHMINGAVGLGKSLVHMRAGSAEPIVVKPDTDRNIGWGGPARAEFAYARRGNEVQLSPDAVWYYGKQGEEYVGWTPLGKSPKFTFTSTKSGREIAEAFFPGSC